MTLWLDGKLPFLKFITSELNQPLSLPETQSAWSAVTNRLMLAGDGRFLQIDLVGGLLGYFRSRRSLEAENLVLRQQLNVLHRECPARIAFSGIDRMVFAGLYALAPNVLDALKIVKPDTVIRWHRAGFRAYWHWKSRARGRGPAGPETITAPCSPSSGSGEYLLSWTKVVGPDHYSPSYPRR